MRNIAVVGLVILAGVFIPGAAAGSSPRLAYGLAEMPMSGLAEQADMECDWNRGSKVNLLDVTVQNTIANGRTTLDALTNMRVDGTATFTVTAGGGAVGSAATTIRWPQRTAENRWVLITGLPATGDLILIVTLAPTDDGWNTYTCPAITIPIKRTAGIILLGGWDSTPESSYLEKWAWGKITYNETTGGNARWSRGSCQNLAVAPINIKVESTGVAGSKTTKTLVKDQCDLVPPAKAKKKVKVLAGTVIIGSGSVIFKSTLRQAGTQRYKVAMTTPLRKPIGQ